jgi:hypothetical protein
MSFVISALPKSKCDHLFRSLPDDQIVRTIATKKPGFPCRVSLTDAEIGEEVVLIHYEHQPAETPFRASHAIYVRPNASQANLDVNEVPAMLRSRVLSLRAFDEQGMMVAADLADGTVVEKPLDDMFADPSVAYIHIHFAKPGCYAARADRVKL